MALFAGVEAGGTKFICAVGSGPDDLRDLVRIPTRGPNETLGELVDYLTRAVEKHGSLGAVGIGSFGPVDLRRNAPTWGQIMNTPKPGWSGTDMIGPIRRALGVPVGFDTDVNAAALGELRWGAARGLDSAVYVTVGTGIGGGAVINGRPVHGLIHPEVGHLLLPRHPEDDFKGCCPFHGACLEGLASGTAVAARWGTAGEHLPADHPAWDLEAFYLGQVAVNLTLTLSPQRLIFGGSVLSVPGLIEKVRRQWFEKLGGYLDSEAFSEAGRDYLVTPGLGDRAGILGALELARLAGQGRLTS